MDKKELIERCKEGDGQALGLLYQTYAGRMMKICNYYVPDRQTAQDLLHDGFIIIFTSIHALQSPDRLESWMGTIMKNLSISYLKQRNIRDSLLIPLEEVGEDEEPMDVASADKFPSYATMLRLIEALPEGYCKIFKLAVLEGLSHKEIGLLLDIAPHSSSSQLSRAKEMLRKLFSQHRVMVGVLVLLSVFSLHIFHYTRDEAVVEGYGNVSERNDYEPKEECALPEDTAETTAPHAIIPRQVYAESVQLRAIELPVAHRDTVPETSDTIPAQDKPNVNLAQENGRLCDTPLLKRLSSGRKEWLLAFSCSGGESRIDFRETVIPGDISSEEPKEVREESRHHVPVILALSMQKRINGRWGMETGVQYTCLRSDFTVIGDTHLEKRQKIHYIGIPLKGIFGVWNKRHFSLYTSAGVTLDIPFKAVSEESVMGNNQAVDRKKNPLNPSWQWSTSFGIGVQYQLTSSIGIYAEPNLHYYFHGRNDVKTIRTERPFQVTLPVGIRLSW